MFNLSQYLQQLLLVYPQVGVPGIGILSRERIAARFDEELKRFLPPTYTFTLIPHATIDNYLVNHVAKTHRLSDEEARMEVDKSIDLLLTEINERGEAKLDHIGYLKQANGQYALIPFAFEKFWGLQPVEEPPCLPPSQATIDESNEEPENQEAIGLTTAVTVPEEEGFDSIEEDSRKSRTWMLVAASILLIGVSAFFIWKQQQPASSLINEKQLSTVAIDSSNKVSKVSTVDSVQHNAPMQEQELPLVRKTSKELPYSIVIGSFKKMELAIKQAEYFRTIGINAFVLESKMPNNRKKICYASYPNRQAALEQLEKVRKEINSEAYIYPEH